MASFVSTVELPASPATSWAFVVDRGSEVEPLSFEPQGEQGVGTLNHLSGRVAGIRFRGVSRTVEWDPPRRCAFESVKPSWPIRVFITETFEPSATGTTHSTSYDVTPCGPVGRLVAPLMCRFMRRSRKDFQDRLRIALAENSST